MMTRSAIGRFSSFCLFSLMVLALAGCSIISVDQKTRYRDAEGYFEPTLLTRIQPGETSLTWLTQHFGRPWYSEADGLEGYPEEVGVHTWRFAREQQKNTRVLLLFNSRKTDLQYEYLHVAAEGDIVKRAWKDELATVDIRRLMAAMGYRKVKNPSTELRDRPSTELRDRPSTELRERSATSSETELIAPPVADDIVDMEAEGALPEPALH